MNKSVVGLGILTAALLAFDVPAARSAEPSEAWTPDLVHSRADFTVAHMVLSKVWGHIPIRAITFESAKGSVIPDHLDAMLDVSHEDTDNHDRDADLRSPAYFDTAKYPTMTFKSTKITPSGKEDFNVTGELTIKDVTKSVTFPVHIDGRIPDQTGGTRVGYTGELKVDRRDFHIDDARLTPAGVLLVGYDVHIGLTVEAVTNDPTIRSK
jgi:polyisoprenoid-binding protein YceI